MNEINVFRYVKQTAESVFQKNIYNYTFFFNQKGDKYLRIIFFKSYIPNTMLSISVDIYLDHIFVHGIKTGEDTHVPFLKDLETFAKQMYFME